MASKVDLLLSAFEPVISEPWVSSLSGQERVWFLVYDPAEQRKVDLRIDDFEVATKKAGKKWHAISLKNVFPTWMAGHDYKEEYFLDPGALVDQLESDFKKFAVDYIIKELQHPEIDSNTLVAVRDASALFGFCRLSDVIHGCASELKGRMLIFFPGEYYKNQYRLLDARDGWSYLARPITI
jgi:hypothetical protein